MMIAATGAKGRRARYGEEMRQDILHAARQIIAEEGAGALSIRGIARRIGYSAPALYEYFTGKEAIAQALFVGGFRQLEAMMAEVTEPDPLLRLRALGIVYRQFAMAHPQEYSLMFSRPIPEYRPSHEDLEVATTGFAHLQHTVAEGVAAGVLRPMDARTGATEAWAFMHGLVSLELAGMGGPPPEQPFAPGRVAPSYFPALYEEALDLFGEAIRAR